MQKDFNDKAAELSDDDKIMRLYYVALRRRLKARYGKTDDGYSPLHVAAAKGETAQVAKLIADGADANMRGWEDKPLHRAAFGGYIGTAQVLLEAGADINAQRFSDYTPLHLAVIGNQPEMVGFLIGRGADARLKDVDDMTARDMARLGGHDSMVQWLDALQLALPGQSEQKAAAVLKDVKVVAKTPKSGL